jgi:hypothetical protein
MKYLLHPGAVILFTGIRDRNPQAVFEIIRQTRRAAPRLAKS